MKVEYLVLEVVEARKGALQWVRLRKSEKRWDALQDALDELGKEGWGLSKGIYGPAGDGRPGDHYCEGFIFQRGSALEYTVLEVAVQKGPLQGLWCRKTSKTWNGRSALQDALDELGQEGWALSMSIYGPTYGVPGTHFCEGFVLQRTPV